MNDSWVGFAVREYGAVAYVPERIESASFRGDPKVFMSVSGSFACGGRCLRSHQSRRLVNYDNRVHTKPGAQSDDEAHNIDTAPCGVTSSPCGYT